MAGYVTYCGAFNLAGYGSVEIDWTDASGVHNGVVSLTTGTYVHGTIAATMSVSGYTNFIATLVAAMDAATAQTVTGSFSETTGLMTLACTGGTFDITFPGAAGTRMKALLGMPGTVTGSTSYTGTVHPVYVIKPLYPCVSGNPNPSREKGRTATKSTSDGSMYRLAASTIRKLSSWTHLYEPKGMCDRTWYDQVGPGGSGLNRYTWEDLWDDYGDHVLPIFAAWYSSASTGEIEYLCFDLTTDVYDDTTHARMRANDDTRWRITVAASLRAREVTV